MGLHLAAFGSSTALTSVNQNQPLITETYLSQDQSGNALCPIPMKVLDVYGSGVGMDKLRIVVPSLKRISLPRIAHFDVGAIAPANPNYENIEKFPWSIGMSESWNFQSDNSNAGAQNHMVLAFLQDSYTPIPPGPSWTFFGTAAVVSANRTWASGQITWEDSYVNALYAVIGLRVVGVNVFAARLVPSQAGPRPGCIGQTIENTVDRSITWDGRFGQLFTFRPPQFPAIEILGNGATAAQRVYVQVVPIGPAL